jgi:signal transduction histidine kinase
MSRETRAGRDVASLAMPFDPIAPDVPLEQVAELFLNPEHAHVLSLPVVDEGCPIGVISRYRFSEIYLKLYGRELYGKRPIRGFVNSEPIIVEHNQPLADAALHVTEKMRFPLTEDFIITEQGRYVGIGFVMDLLKAMELQMREHSEELSDAYARLKSSQLALVQSEKMASLGQMVAGIAHEINTPLGYVQNNVTVGQELFGQVHAMMAGYGALVDSLLDGQATEEQISLQMGQVASMRAGTDAFAMLGEMQGLMADSLYGIAQISELVANLKNFSRMDAAATENTSLNDCIESALNIGRNVLKNRIEVVRELGDIPKITCSPSQLNQVFLNLFTNAAQAMADTGRLSIRSWYEDGMVRVSVADTGNGIPPENLSRIFDPFFTTKPIGEGTGLGLAITHQIVQQHGGEIHVTSRPGEGTRFDIRLPAKASSRQAGSMPVAA